MINSIYKEIILSKNNQQICVLSNGKTIDSRYNPQQSCENTLKEIDLNHKFFIIGGFSSGLLCSLLLEKIPDAKIIALEINQEDFDFLESLNNFKILTNNKQVIFSTLKELKKNIIDNYLPALHGSLQFIEQLPWLEINNQYLPEIQKAINDSIKEISADYSVQAHFGKIWMHNILRNLKLIESVNTTLDPIDNSKTALIVAAGPSLDSKISWIKENRNNFIIFSTDTAYQVLAKQNIIADYLVSIDGQNISYNHFYTVDKKTIVLMDLCGSCSAASHFIDNDQNLFFFVSGHPFCSLINNYLINQFPVINNGSGTVTIAALDIAIKSGFSYIKVIGADFSFPNNKSYSKGTYLDSLYNLNSSKLFNTESTYDKLMYRTELIENENKTKTTEILNSYKQSFLCYLHTFSANVEYKDYTYNIEIVPNTHSINFSNRSFSFSTLIQNLLNTPEQNLLLALLPLIAYFRKADENSQNLESYTKLALSYIVRYN